MCNYVSGLQDTGNAWPGTTTDSEGNVCGTDMYWKANGVDARIVNRIPPYGWGCSYAVWISDVCDGDTDTALDNGGLDGKEIIFSIDFFIAEHACLDRIVISGEYSADNYVKEGEWKVNGIDQCQIYHGTFYNTLGLGCIPFEITAEQGGFGHGVNTVEITVKNGYYGVGEYGGPHLFKMRWACFDRLDMPEESSSSSSCVTEPDDREEED